MEQTDRPTLAQMLTNIGCAKILTALLSFFERFVAMAMPKAQHFYNAVRFFYQVEDAIRAFENRKLLCLRVGSVPKIAASVGGAGMA